MQEEQDALAAVCQFLQPDETAKQLLQRTYVERLHTGVCIIDLDINLRPGHVVEVVGPSGTAKSELLIQAAVARILPACWHGVEYGGHAENVLFIDLDAKFDTLRLVKILDARICAARRESGAALPPQDTLLTECLQRFHVITCHSSLQLLSTLTLLPDLFAHWQAQGAASRLLLLDNVAAFYWGDRAAGRGPSELPPPQLEGAAAIALGAVASQLGLHQVHTAAAGHLRNLMRQFRLTVLATKQAVLSAGGGGEAADLWLHREFLPQAWRELVTHRLLLRPGPGPGTPGEGMPAQAPSFLARWHLPAQEAVARFGVTDAYIRPFE